MLDGQGEEVDQAAAERRESGPIHRRVEFFHAAPLPPRIDTRPSSKDRPSPEY